MAEGKTDRGAVRNSSTFLTPQQRAVARRARRRLLALFWRRATI